MNLDEVERLARSGADEAALAALDALALRTEESDAGARLALRLGRPRLAVMWWTRALPTLEGETAHRARLGLAAALLRLGRGEEAQGVLRNEPETSRVAVLRARATLEAGDAERARALARAEGDAPALIAAATLLGERLLAAGNAKAALHTLAEGLKVAEVIGEAADAHLLAVLSRAQAKVGSARKARATAQKALERSAPRSPARVLALLALGREEEAEAEARAGELSISTFTF